MFGIFFTAVIRLLADPLISAGLRGNKQQAKYPKVAYSQFVQVVKQGHVESALFEQQSPKIYFRLKRGETIIKSIESAGKDQNELQEVLSQSNFQSKLQQTLVEQIILIQDLNLINLEQLHLRLGGVLKGIEKVPTFGKLNKELKGLEKRMQGMGGTIRESKRIFDVIPKSQITATIQQLQEAKLQQVQLTSQIRGAYQQLETISKEAVPRDIQIKEDSSKIKYFENEDRMLKTSIQNAKVLIWKIDQKQKKLKQVFSEIPAFCTDKVMENQYLIPTLLENSVYVTMIDKTFSTVMGKAITNLLIVWLPLVPFFFFFRNMMQGRNDLRTRNKKADSQAKLTTSFKDVAGVGDAIYELQEVVNILKDPTKYSKMNAKLPGGVLLCGPPGTGKTLLARAVAGEANVNFFAASASEFVELYVGRGAARIRQLFQKARQQKPSLVFIDELDALGGRRGMGLNEEREQTLNQLLTELDGYDSREGVLMLAATNRPQILDPALLRPGRISRKVYIPLPDFEGRAEILQVHMRQTITRSPADKIQMFEQVASLTSGFTGAELSNVVNEATLLSIRKNKDYVEIEDMLEAIQRTKVGINQGTNQNPFFQVVKEWTQGKFSQNRRAGQAMPKY